MQSYLNGLIVSISDIVDKPIIMEDNITRKLQGDGATIQYCI